jgi:hypothetical protein
MRIAILGAVRLQFKDYPCQGTGGEEATLPIVMDPGTGHSELER